MPSIVVCAAILGLIYHFGGVESHRSNLLDLHLYHFRKRELDEACGADVFTNHNDECLRAWYKISREKQFRNFIYDRRENAILERMEALESAKSDEHAKKDEKEK